MLCLGGGTAVHIGVAVGCLATGIAGGPGGVFVAFGVEVVAFVAIHYAQEACYAYCDRHYGD